VAGLAVVDVLVFAVADVPPEQSVASAPAVDVNHHHDTTRKPLPAVAAAAS
jgi:hypothetical protein